MWLSRKTRTAPPTADAELGVTSIAGGSAAVLTRGELRSVPVFSPGGYLWQPAVGQTVLVIRGRPGGEERCLAGAEQPAPPVSMQPGEVFLYSSGGASVYLKADGSAVISGTRIALRGSVAVEGSLSINGSSCNVGKELSTT